MTLPFYYATYAHYYLLYIIIDAITLFDIHIDDYTYAYIIIETLLILLHY